VKVAGRSALLAAAVLTTSAAQAAAGCSLGVRDGRVAAGGPVRLAWRTEPAAVVAGEPFVLIIKTCPPQARLLAVDATMPEHRHGMNYAPSLKALGDGRWRAEGLLWHMSGRWELRLEVGLGDAAHVLRQSVMLP
jgi:hypothetical protein